MSDESNENVLEQLGYCFSEALDRGDIEEARKIIAHVKDLDVLEAKILESELLDTPVLNFAHAAMTLYGNNK